MDFSALERQYGAVKGGQELESFVQTATELYLENKDGRVACLLDKANIGARCSDNACKKFMDNTYYQCIVKV